MRNEVTPAITRVTLMIILSPRMNSVGSSEKSFSDVKVEMDFEKINLKENQCHHQPPETSHPVGPEPSPPFGFLTSSWGVLRAS